MAAGIFIFAVGPTQSSLVTRLSNYGARGALIHATSNTSYHCFECRKRPRQRIVAISDINYAEIIPSSGVQLSRNRLAEKGPEEGGLGGGWWGWGELIPPFWTSTFGGVFLGTSFSYRQLLSVSFTVCYRFLLQHYITVHALWLNLRVRQQVTQHKCRQVKLAVVYTRWLLSVGWHHRHYYTECRWHRLWHEHTYGWQRTIYIYIYIYVCVCVCVRMKLHLLVHSPQIKVPSGGGGVGGGRRQRKRDLEVKNTHTHTHTHKYHRSHFCA